MNIFTSLDPAVKKLLGWKLGDEEEKWALKAIESLVKKMRKRKHIGFGTVEDLEYALAHPGSHSKCVTIPRSLDGRLQVSHRKGLPHVIYCRVWRWPNIQSHHELKPTPDCLYPYDGRNEQICINPYHYQRIEAPSTKSQTLPTPRNTQQFTQLTQQQHQPAFLPTVHSPTANLTQINFGVTNQNGMHPNLLHQFNVNSPNPSNAPSPAGSNGVGLNGTNCSNGQILLAQSPQSMSSLMSPCSTNVAVSPAPSSASSNASPLSNVSTGQAFSPFLQLQTRQQSLGYSPPQQQSMLQQSPSAASPFLIQSPSALSDDDDFALIQQQRQFFTTMINGNGANNRPGIPAWNEKPTSLRPTPEYWCSICYYELNSRVGEPFKLSKSSVTVDGFTAPFIDNLNDEERVCLGLLSNVNRNVTIENTRRHIGKGIRLSCTDCNVVLLNKSDSAVFIQSRNANFKYNLQSTAVCRVPPQSTMLVFDYQLFSGMLEKAKASTNFENVYELQKMCFIRLSFVKGWGADYHRQDVTSTPCWLEIQLHQPLAWIDAALKPLEPPKHMDVTSVS